jgi:hypothetical protein
MSLASHLHIFKHVKDKVPFLVSSLVKDGALFFASGFALENKQI